MITRCDACQRPFVAKRSGSQPCPHCRADVVVESPEGLPPLPTTEPAPAAPAAASTVEELGDDDAPAPTSRTLPSPAELGFFTTLALFLMAPLRAFERVDEVPTRVGVRFGFLAAFAGIMGRSIGYWAAGQPTEYATVDGVLPAAQVACLLEQQRAWDAAMHPWLLARIPVAPLLALALVYGLSHLFHLMAAAMMEKNPVELPVLARNVGFACAPLALAGLFPFGVCLWWALVLCGVAIRRACGFPWWVALGMASLPMCAWLAGWFIVSARLALPCWQVV